MINIRAISFCALGVALCMASAAQARDIEQPFVALDYSLHNYQNANTTASDASPSSVRFRAGSVVNPHFAVEAHLAFGASDDTTTITTSGGTSSYQLSVQEIYGLFLRPQIQFSPISLYALAGYSHAGIKFSPAPAGISPTRSTNDFSYGGGAQFDIGKNWGISADFVHYVEGLDTVSGGIVYRF